MSLGAAITGLTLPDGEDIVLGYSSLAQYQAGDNPYFGATVGRVANRSVPTCSMVEYSSSVQDQGREVQCGRGGVQRHRQQRAQHPARRHPGLGQEELESLGGD